MAKSVSKAADNMYAIARLNAGFTSRDKAAEGLPFCARTLAEIELGETPTPDQVNYMAIRYNHNTLTAWYCAEECPIGQRYAHRVEEKDLSGATIGLLKGFNAAKKYIERLIEIAEDNAITDDEIPDLTEIMEQILALEEYIDAYKLRVAKVIPIDKMIQRRKNKKTLGFVAEPKAAYKTI